MDGVLVNTEPLHYECWKAALADEGVDMSYEVYKPCIGSTVGYLMKLLKEAYGETVSDAETLRQRREAIQSKMALARAQEKAANVMGSHTGADESRLGDAIARMEDKADAMLDRSNAMQSLNETPLDPAAELEKKYADGAKNAAVEDELEKMKKEMGL